MSGKRKSISLNCSVTPASLSSAPETPNTPEILNAIINISSDHLETLSRSAIKTEPTNNENNEYAANTNTITACRYDFSGRFPPGPEFPPSVQCLDQHSSPEAGRHHRGSPLGPGVTVRNYHSQFVKEGLKLKVKQKIKDESPSLISNYGSEDGDSKLEGDLTHEDEERRYRRRERNKIAATKCRNKKKEKTTRLIAEGEVLEIQNASLKEEINKLEAEKRSLNDLLTSHEPQCKAKKLKLETNSRKGENRCEFRSQDEFNRKEKPQVNRFHEEKKRQHLQRNSQIDFPNRGQFNNFDYNFDNSNMFIKQETDQCMDYFGQTEGYFHYGFYPSMNKSNIFDGQSLCLSNYPLSGVDNRCLAL